MTGWFVRMIGGVLRGASTHRHPSAIALAIAFGLAIGLIPKDNLFVLGLAASMWFFRMNYLLALVLIVAISNGVPWTDAATDKVGQWMLESPNLQSVWHRLATWPIMPWFRWNNTVVLGGILVGMASFLPSYAICTLLSRQWVRSRMLNRVDAVVHAMKDDPIQIQADQLIHKPQATFDDPPQLARRRSNKKHERQRHRIDPTRSDDQIKPNIVSPRTEPAMAIVSNEPPSQSGSAVLQETVIEIVRYRPKSHRALPTKGDAPQQNSQNTENRIPLMNTIDSLPKVSESQKLQLEVSHPPVDGPSCSEDRSERDTNLMPVDEEPALEKPREEALRYLLWHLSGMHRQPRHEESVS